MYEPIHVRITKKQYEWLRRYCFENRVAQAEVIREALETFREAKEGTTMRKIEVVVIEAGLDYMDRLESFEMELPEDKDQAVAEAIEAVEARGYNVIPDDQGGCNEYVSVSGGEDYIAITVEPE
ncbi:hypothetical protein [Candidatus Darwinibacter acetoxidans]